jgi:hypothetical protein
MMRYRWMLLLLILFYGISGIAQESEVVSDLRLWTGVKVEKRFAKDWSLSLEEQIRFKQNISEISNIFTELELRYRINRNFALGAGYRYTSDRKADGSYTGYSRNHFSLRYRGRLEHFMVTYRLKYQREVEAANTFDRDAPYEKQFRNRIGLRVTVFDLVQPYVTGEVLQVFSPYLSPLNDYWRLVAGVRIEPENLGEFRLGWGFNREFASDNPFMIYMLRVHYTYSF